MNLRDHLRTTRIRQRELADRLGVSDATVSKWLSGKQAMSAHDVFRVAEALELDPADVLHGVADAQARASQ